MKLEPRAVLLQGMKKKGDDNDDDDGGRMKREADSEETISVLEMKGSQRKSFGCLDSGCCCAAYFGFDGGIPCLLFR